MRRITSSRRRAASSSLMVSSGVDFAMFMPALRFRKKDAGILARLLTGFGELELIMTFCLGSAIASQRERLQQHSGPYRRHHYDKVARKCFFKIRNSEDRLIKAKTCMRPAFVAHELAGDFDYVMNAVESCRLIRNQFAHCQWAQSRKRGLFFANLEESAASSANAKIKFRHASPSALEACETYYWHTSEYLNWLLHALAINAELIRAPLPVRPKRMRQLSRPRDLFPPSDPNLRRVRARRPRPPSPAR